VPIKQDRMIALVRAADSALAKLQALREACLAALANPDKEASLAAIAELLMSTAYSPEIDHIETIVSERVHFRLREHTNNRNAARLRRKRGSPAEQGDESYLTVDSRPQAVLSDIDEALDGDIALPGAQ
jgi:hypothetical protein